MSAKRYINSRNVVPDHFPDDRKEVNTRKGTNGNKKNNENVMKYLDVYNKNVIFAILKHKPVYEILRINQTLNICRMLC